jgi:hypothetical protein
LVWAKSEHDTVSHRLVIICLCSVLVWTSFVYPFWCFDGCFARGWILIPNLKYDFCSGWWCANELMLKCMLMNNWDFKTINMYKITINRQIKHVCYHFGDASGVEVSGHRLHFVWNWTHFIRCCFLFEYFGKCC